MEFNNSINFHMNSIDGHSKKRIRSGANARERDRTQSVNSAFDVLRTMIPIDPPERKLSKIETLQLATKYINHLSQILTSVEVLKKTDFIVWYKRSQKIKSKQAIKRKRNK